MLHVTQYESDTQKKYFRNAQELRTLSKLNLCRTSLEESACSIRHIPHWPIGLLLICSIVSALFVRMRDATVAELSQVSPLLPKFKFLRPAWHTSGSSICRTLSIHDNTHT